MIYHVNTGGTSSGSGTQDDPMTWEGISALSLGTGDHVLFHAGQTHIVGSTLFIDHNGTEEYPVIYGSYGGGKAVLDTTGMHDLFHVGDSQYVSVQNLNLNVATTGASIFLATGTFNDIDIYDVTTVSGGSFWKEIEFGPRNGTYSINDCEINRMWGYGVLSNGATGTIKRTTFNRCGYNTDNVANYGPIQGYAVLLIGSGQVRSQDCRFTDNRGDIVSSANIVSTGIFERAYIHDYANTGQSALDNLMVFQSASGNINMKNSIMHSSGSMVQYIAYSIGALVQPGITLHNCGLVYSSPSPLGGSMVNGGVMVATNNIIQHTVSVGLPSFNIGFIFNSNNIYDVDAGAAAGFFPGNSWAAYESSETNSNTGASGLDPFWFANTNGQMSTGSSLIGLGSGATATPTDASNMYRDVDDGDIGPYQRTYETLKQYTRGGYGRHGFAPS